MNHEINVLALVKGDERYIFLYDDKNRVETLRMLGRYAADPELSFNWFDAALMSQKIRDFATDEEIQKQQQRTSTTARFHFNHKEDMI